jgi:hypothetical protein
MFAYSVDSLFASCERTFINRRQPMRSQFDPTPEEALLKRIADANYKDGLDNETPEERRERIAFSALCKCEARVRVARRLGHPVDAPMANLALAMDEHQAALAALKASRAYRAGRSGVVS